MLVVEELLSFPKNTSHLWAEETWRLMSPWGPELEGFLESCPLLIQVRDDDTVLFLGGVMMETPLSRDQEVWIIPFKTVQEQPVKSLRAMKKIWATYRERYPEIYARVAADSIPATRLAKTVGLVPMETTYNQLGQLCRVFREKV